MATSYETDRAIALALDQRRQSEVDEQAQQLFDESLARTLQDDELSHIERGDLHAPTCMGGSGISASICRQCKVPQDVC